MKDLKNKIASIENKWLDSLYKHCKGIFNDHKIISHDHKHHLRVWEYAKDILYTLNKSYEIKNELIESCLIASMFHDTGLTVNLGKNHGYESRKFCEKFFENSEFQKPQSYNEILFAIETHDDKEYKQNNTAPDSLFSIVCNADDLEAFGKIGIIRYTEIYLLRGIEFEVLPISIINNLDKRFYNFEKSYKSFSELYQKHKSRYLVARKFFEELHQEFTHG